jgi:hypothetical protein
LSDSQTRILHPLINEPLDQIRERHVYQGLRTLVFNLRDFARITRMSDRVRADYHEFQRVVERELAAANRTTPGNLTERRRSVSPDPQADAVYRRIIDAYDRLIRPHLRRFGDRHLEHALE